MLSVYTGTGGLSVHGGDDEGAFGQVFAAGARVDLEAVAGYAIRDGQKIPITWGAAIGAKFAHLFTEADASSAAPSFEAHEDLDVDEPSERPAPRRR